MKRLLGVTFVIGLLAGAGAAVAQDTGPYSFATYYKCDQNREAFADVIQENVIGPILDDRVAAGQLVAWGWLSHRVGGAWRRVEYMIAPDRAMLLAARDAVIDIYQEDDEAQTATRELTDICPDHDDYIWRTVATSDPDAVGQGDATGRDGDLFRVRHRPGKPGRRARQRGVRPDLQPPYGARRLRVLELAGT